MDKDLKSYRDTLNKTYDYKIAGPSKEDEKKLTKNDIELVKSLLKSHICGVSFFSPRQFLGYYSNHYKVIEGIRCSIYISDGDYKDSNVFTRVEDIRVFKNYGGIEAIAREHFDRNGQKCWRVSFLTHAVRYSDGEEYCLDTGNEYKEKAHIDIYNEKEWKKLVDNFDNYKNNPYSFAPKKDDLMDMLNAIEPIDLFNKNTTAKEALEFYSHIMKAFAKYNSNELDLDGKDCQKLSEILEQKGCVTLDNYKKLQQERPDFFPSKKESIGDLMKEPNDIGLPASAAANAIANPSFTAGFCFGPDDFCDRWSKKYDESLKENKTF